MEYAQLKHPSPVPKPFPGHSDILVPTHVPSGLYPRRHYLDHPSSVLAPVISSSPFIPAHFIGHLMRRKKNSALAVKFQAHSGTDEITNMEGVLHTFVTPICLAFMHGDYRYNGGHGVVRFPDAILPNSDKKVQQARHVVISASVQPDFEGPQVMLAACILRNSAVVGHRITSSFEVLDVRQKQNDEKRKAYDSELRAHLIYNLTRAHRLPGLHEATGRIINVSAAQRLLDEQIVAPKTNYIAICEAYVRLSNAATISLEMLFHTVVQQLRNEISALETLCPQGYVYTLDPPSIFARGIGATLLNRIQFAALKWLAEGGSKFLNLRAFAFNDYADHDTIRLLQYCLQKQSHVRVLPKALLFPTPGGLYKALPGTEDALLVVHNNSGMFCLSYKTIRKSTSWSFLLKMGVFNLKLTGQMRSARILRPSGKVGVWTGQLG
jgi:hypothetical protein